jgi:hypothetical protein
MRKLDHNMIKKKIQLRMDPEELKTCICISDHEKKFHE